MADFVIDQYTANCPPLLCSFVDASSSSVINWEWSFSDSSLYQTQNPSKLFNESGSYDIQLVVNDSIGCSDTLKIDDAIQINGPSGNFSISDLEVCAQSLSSFRQIHKIQIISYGILEMEIFHLIQQKHIFIIKWGILPSAYNYKCIWMPRDSFSRFCNCRKQHRIY